MNTVSPLSIPTHATGTPFGIWTMDNSASSPPSLELTGTPMTGFIVLHLNFTRSAICLSDSEPVNIATVTIVLIWAIKHKNLISKG